MNFMEFKQTWPYICINCRVLYKDKKYICTECKREGSVRRVIKADYNAWKGKNGD